MTTDSQFTKYLAIIRNNMHNKKNLITYKPFGVKTTHLNRIQIFLEKHALPQFLYQISKVAQTLNPQTKKHPIHHIYSNKYQHVFFA